MGEQATLALIELLGKTLRHLEQNSDPHDGAVQHLRHSILLIIAELELARADKKAA
jgi:hypothetical protein